MAKNNWRCLNCENLLLLDEIPKGHQVCCGTCGHETIRFYDRSEIFFDLGEGEYYYRHPSWPSATYEHVKVIGKGSDMRMKMHPDLIGLRFDNLTSHAQFYIDRPKNMAD
jgi:DNA-directed RNA polymerase subunit RPC12/RpoP